MTFKIVPILVLSLFLLSCENDFNNPELDNALKAAMEKAAKTGVVDYYIFPESDDYSNLPNQDPANPITKEKVELGRFLFFETGLAQTPFDDKCFEAYSCSSCHVPDSGFLPGRIQGVADGAFGFGEEGNYRTLAPNYTEFDVDAQGNRPMNPMNSGYSTVAAWSGIFGAHGPNEGTENSWTGLAEVNHTGYMGLEAQNIEAFDLHRLSINEKVLDEYGYRALFDEAFPDFLEEERYTPVTGSFAISAFLRSFMANEAPFQDYLKGDQNALSENQKEGALLFFGKAGCSSCHNETALSAMKFYRLGTADMYQVGPAMNTGPDDIRNLGRGMFTGVENDMRKYKVPQLYNLKKYKTFFHGSSKNSIEEVVVYKMKAVSENPYVENSELSGFFQPVELTDKEKSNLIDFLENGLYDSNYKRYVPTSLPSGNCFPNNDFLSRMDMGCN